MLNKSQPHGWLLSALYEMEDGWAQGTLALLDALLATQEQQGERLPKEILEIGCGNGSVLRYLRQRFLHASVHGIDLNTTALQQAKQRSQPTASLSQANLTQLPFASNRFSLIVSLDVFDQAEVDLARALQESQRILQPQGHLLLRVSAHPWLYGPHDVAFNTGVRLQQSELVQMLRQSGFAPVRITYSNTLLALPVMLVRLLQRWQWIGFDESLYHSTFVDRLLEAALQIEAAWLRLAPLPFGLSLMVIAKKEGK